MKKLTVICVLRYDEGCPYGADDVLKLKNGFDRFLSIDHDFVCLTNITNLPITTIPLISQSTGWWSKLELFRKDLFDGPVFYIDLDMVICADLNPIIERCVAENFVMLSNHEYSVNKDNMPASGVMYWNGDFSYLWEEYSKDPLHWQKTYNKHPKLGDQAFISDRVKWKSFFEISGIDKRWFTWLDKKMSTLADTKILIGEGKKRKPSNPEFQNNTFIKKYWTL
jgi:hypothetical protein